MSLRDTARGRQVKRRGPMSTLGKALTAATPKKRADVVDCIEGAAVKEYTWTVCAEIVSESLGVRVTEEMIRRFHRDPIDLEADG